MKQTFIGLFILLIAILVISLFYSYPSMFHLLPQGSHLWRQADCMAMTQNYQQFHLSFWNPATYNLQSLNGKVVGEFPVFYFIAAQFKNAAFILRLVHTIVFFTGILATYFIAFYFLQRRFLSIVCSLLLFTSPLLVFYGNNFLSDVPALSFAFIGWAIFLNAYKKENLFWLSIAFLCFAFAGLLKASQMINLAIVFFFLINLKTKKLIFRLSILWTIACGLIIFSWYFYAKQYNHQNYDHYYFLSVFPIWKVELQDIGLGIWRMVVSLSKNYFWRPTSILLILSCYYVFKHRKKLDAELRIVITTSFAIVSAYIILFYQKLIGHEYYYVPFFIFFLFAIIGILKTYNFFHAENVFTHTAIFLLLIPNLIFCKVFVAEKLTDNLYNGYLSSNEMQNFLLTNNVGKNNIILSLPDDSPNKTLSLIKRKGYTEFNNYRTVLRNKQADFLILGNENWKQKESLKTYLNDSIGFFNGYTLYKLR